MSDYDWTEVPDEDYYNPQQALREGIKSEVALYVWEWADKYRELTTKSAAEPGRYRTSRAPFLREIMENLSPQSPVTRTSVMKGTQLGFSEVGNNWVGFLIHHSPAPILVVQPTVELAKRFSKQRIDPMISASKVLRSCVMDSKTPGSGNTMLQKDFPGGTLVLTGANSAVGLRSMPACYLFLDEAETYEGDIGGEGDPVALAQARSDTYGFRAKQYLPSTPKVSGESRIEAEFLAGDQRRYFIPCPHCGYKQWLKPERFKWDRMNPSDVHYVCEANNCKIEEYHKTKFLAEGEWVPTAIPETPNHRSYQISSFYAPLGWLSWEKIAREWMRSARRGPEAMKTFVNTRLGETWKEAGEAPDLDKLLERREELPRRVVPSRALALTAGVDSQHDRLECYVWAWAPGPERWLIHRFIIELPPTNPEAWRELDRKMEEKYPREDGGYMYVDRACVDTGNQMTASIYRGLMEIRNPRLIPIKGTDVLDSNMPVSSGKYVSVKANGKVHKRGLKLRIVAVDTFKLELYRMLMQPRGEDEDKFPETWVHWPQWADRETTEQLLAEKRVKEKTRGGGAKFKWVPHRERNEALDCAIYARAALYVIADALGRTFWENRAAALHQYIDSLDDLELEDNEDGVVEESTEGEEDEFYDADADPSVQRDVPDRVSVDDRRSASPEPDTGEARVRDSDDRPAVAAVDRRESVIPAWNSGRKRVARRTRSSIPSSYVTG